MHRRWLFIAAAGALIVASLIVGLVVDRKDDTGGAEAKPAGGTQANVPPATVSPTASVSATGASAKPSAKSTPRKESARATATSAKPSARTPADRFRRRAVGGAHTARYHLPRRRHVLRRGRFGRLYVRRER